MFNLHTYLLNKINDHKSNLVEILKCKRHQNIPSKISSIFQISTPLTTVFSYCTIPTLRKFQAQSEELQTEVTELNHQWSHIPFRHIRIHTSVFYYLLFT